MEKIGTIIKLSKFKPHGGAQIATVAFDMPEEALCSIKSTDSRGCCCSSCACSGCGKTGGENGLFIVHGNIVNALNTTGDELHIGKRVHVFISEKAALFQAVCAVGIPLFLAGTLFSVIYLRTHSEGFALAGLAGGIAAGVCIAFGINSIVKERALPQIVTIL